MNRPHKLSCERLYPKSIYGNVFGKLVENINVSDMCTYSQLTKKYV